MLKLQKYVEKPFLVGSVFVGDVNIVLPAVRMAFNDLLSVRRRVVTLVWSGYQKGHSILPRGFYLSRKLVSSSTATWNYVLQGLCSRKV